MHRAWMAEVGAVSEAPLLGAQAICVPWCVRSPALEPFPARSSPEYGNRVWLALSDRLRMAGLLRMWFGFSSAYSLLGGRSIPHRLEYTPSLIVAALSPYIRHHINRFGHYQLDLAQHSPPIEYGLPIPTKKRQEKLTGQAAPTRHKKKQRRNARRRQLAN
jgi:hypothetical protein